MGWKFKDKLWVVQESVFLPAGHALRVLIERAMLRRFPVHLASRYPLFHVKCRCGCTIIALSFPRLGVIMGELDMVLCFWQQMVAP